MMLYSGDVVLMVCLFLLCRLGEQRFFLSGGVAILCDTATSFIPPSRHIDASDGCIAMHQQCML